MEKKFQRQDSSKQTEQFSYTRDIISILSENLGQDFLEYRKRFENAAKFDLETKFPVHIDFETIFGCNIKCVMCTHSNPEASKRRKRFMDFGLFKNIIDEGVKYGLSSIGLDQEGEPLLVDNLMDYISYAREKGILDIMINTNALILDDERAQKILNSGLTRIHFSLDAVTEDSYKKIRKGSDFNRVVSNILNFCKKKKESGKALPVTRVSFVKMSHNEHEIDDFIKFWTPHVDAIAIQEYNNPFPEDESKEDRYAKNRIVNKDFKCTQPWFRVVVLTDGTVLPCCLLGISLKMAIGNVKEHSIYELWNSETMKNLRAIHKEGRFKEHKVCSKCAENFL